MQSRALLKIDPQGRNFEELRSVFNNIVVFVSIIRPLKPASNSGNMAPPKPWERVGSPSGPTPFRPPSTGNTSTVVESAGVAKLGEKNPETERNVPPSNGSTIGRPMPRRPWEQNNGGYGSGTNYNSGYNYSSGYGSNLHGVGGAYGGGLYGSNMYRGSGPYGSYGGFYGGAGQYGLGGRYNNGFGGPMGGYGTWSGGPFDNVSGDPNNPFDGPPPPPPNFWQSMFRVLHGVVTFFGRISFLVDQNTQAFHIFISALLQLFDLTGVLYGELARFVLRLLGIRTKPRGIPRPGRRTISDQKTPENYYLKDTGAWDNVWKD